MEKSNQLYNTGLYFRLSKEDGDKEESDSISNQKDYVRSYLKNHTELIEKDIYVDDGYRGGNFQRPDFIRMMEDIKRKKINCIIVKDLSRFGRNYLETGIYVEKLFPQLGIRFIAINDGYDSLNKNLSDSILVPFKNLMNDAYSGDISSKIRSHLDSKRKKGELVSAFTPYGYKKSQDNKNQLVIDEESAAVIRNIFAWKLEGYSTITIAKKLNALGIFSPLEYKLEQGIQISQNFKRKNTATWTSGTVARILKNEVYVGNLIQGKETTKNYKSREKVKKEKTQWIKVLKTHEPIISIEVFEKVQTLLEWDTRKAPNKEKLYLLSGYLICADCGQNMVRKNVPSKNQVYTYYVCTTNKNTKECSSHSISEKKITNAIVSAITNQINHIMDMNEIMERIDEITFKNKEDQLDIRLKKKQEEIEKMKERKNNVYEDYKEGVLTKEEYAQLKEAYERKIQKMLLECEEIGKQITNIMEVEDRERTWINQFKKYQNITELTREMLLDIVIKIYVYEKGRIEIQYKYADEYTKALLLVME